MDRREFLLEMRKNGLLKGSKPCFVIVKPVDKNIEIKANGQYIMSLKENTLYFQKISRLFAMLRPNGDFRIDIKDFVCYKLENYRIRNSFTLFKENGSRISIEYMVGTRETLSTEENVERIIKDITLLGIKKME